MKESGVMAEPRLFMANTDMCKDVKFAGLPSYAQGINTLTNAVKVTGARAWLSGRSSRISWDELTVTVTKQSSSLRAAVRELGAWLVKDVIATNDEADALRDYDGFWHKPSSKKE
jgi:hypothetical protein